MTKNQIQILEDYHLGKISRNEFLQRFGEEIEDIEFIRKELKQSIKTKDEERIESAICLMWFNSDYEKFIDELNILLLEPNHRSHQVVTKTIQDLGNPKSVPFIRQALESNFNYLEYTCSESDAIAKWFSWALYSIGTEEAIKTIKDFTKSQDEGIRNEMIYRLNKVKK